MLEVIEDKVEIKNTQKRLENLLAKHKTKSDKIIMGYRGAKGKWQCTAFWFEKDNIWFAHDATPGESYYNVFGIGEPKWGKNNSMLVQANIRLTGSKTAGAFARDSARNVFLVHTGRLGGGEKGICKELFWKKFGGKNDYAKYGKGNEKVVKVAKLDDKNILSQISKFVWEVARIRNAIPTSIMQNSLSSLSLEFKEEYQNLIKYKNRRNIKFIRKHGLVVNKLGEILKKRNKVIGNDKLMDIFIVQRNNISKLFEIKTDSSTPSLYGAIGQLFYNSAMLTRKPTLIAVFPKSLRDKSKDIFAKIGIECLTYEWKKDKPVFDEKAIRKVAVKPAPTLSSAP